jgi:hypothetical protein
MLATHELLDRLELIYDDKPRIKDLRRSFIDNDLPSLFRLFKQQDSNYFELDELRKAVIEQNLHSIFRLVSKITQDTDQSKAKEYYFIEELRKAIVEQNLHSLFRLVDEEELRKIILEENIWSLWRWLDTEIGSELIRGLKRLYVNKVQIDPSCMSRGQILSKLWLIKEVRRLDLEFGTAFICAGWYGILATLLFEAGVPLKAVRSFDIDATCTEVADSFNLKWKQDGWKFKAITQNITDIDYTQHSWEAWSKVNNSMSKVTESPQTIINTSCEHIADFNTWYDRLPAGVLLVLQNNNYYEISTHVNCVQSLEQMTKQCPMSEVYYSGALDLGKYTRFMLIGRK